jgi:hypothetical protein
MAVMPHLPITGKPSLEQSLENAVVLSWNELMPAAISGIIHVEYHLGAEHSLEYLKVWASSERGHWSLICEFWKCSLWSHIPGISFGKGYGPGAFSLRLEAVMNHADYLDKAPQQDGSILIYPPTAVESQAAETSMEALVA